MTLQPGLEPGVVAEREDASRENDPQSSKKLASKSPTQIALQRLRKDKVAVVCGSILLLLIVLALAAPLITRAMGIFPEINSPGAGNLGADLDQFGYPEIGPPYYGFTWEHPLGIAPSRGVDNLANLLYGLRTSLLVATLATIISTFVGITIGLMAGFSRGWLDRFLSFVIDLFLSFPFLLGALTLAPILTSRFSTDLDALDRAQLLGLVAVLVIFGWMSLARLIRGQVLSLREREFVQSAQVIGVPTRRILFKELLPNMVAPIVVATSLSLPAYVAAEAGLSYLGIGLTGQPSLGQTILLATEYYSTYGLYLWVPVGVVAVLVLALNLLGDSVRDAFDPRTRR
ncbi:ABC transporter permease [Nocardioides sp. AX2bis]|uniref:ABC transporter permease n=1 Tax=Nocardioides sp. AX2bis TaxID=2653157 RepID=UPI0012F3A767|nr:ABC transporter permease [Nocardioides sp. AX2bis]VXB35917.1 Peptide ABC transporter permease [Nocardioides sp. AX2bis]